VNVDQVTAPDRFIPTRAAGRERLARFSPHAGRAYAAERNTDTGPGDRSNVSLLSPYVRHRLITEAEVVSAVLGRHSTSAAEKFIQEVCWRTYWKGWLEMRPAIWRHYQQDVTRLRTSVDASLAARLAAAESGTTGIDCFDAWARELVNTGYLHNHTRMWFASIWIYTLGLRWQLGADFLMRHLLDGDPASNTLSWRWVCGLQTPGKTYLARADNIERYTNGRFAPHGALATEAAPLTDSFSMPKAVKVGPGDAMPATGRVVLILCEDDLNPESWGVAPSQVVAVVGLRTADAYPGTSPLVVTFKQAALADAMARAQATFACPVLVLPARQRDVADAIMAFATQCKATELVEMASPVGPTADAITPVLAALKAAGWSNRRLRRRWDALFWPHATHGYFKLKDQIPAVLREIGLDAAPELPLG
jgi:deoxyribodipyrimidine photo-lyase